MEPLDDTEISDRLAALGGPWRREGDTLVADLERANFMDVVGLVDRIAGEAERANHHPDLLIHGYKRLRITLSTHEASGITARDFDLAAAIDAL